MKYFVKFDWWVFFVSLVMFGVLAFISFVFVFGKEEGTLEIPVLSDLMVAVFFILRFPAHNILWVYDYVNGDTFLFGLVFNCILYSFITERIFYFKKCSSFSKPGKLLD